MEKITTDDLKSLLEAIGEFGNQFATIVSVTDARALKTNNPYGVIYKMAKSKILIGWDYRNSVNNQMRREGVEGTFTPKPRKWGVKVPKTAIVEWKGETYVEAKPEKSYGYKYFYIVNGKIAFLTKRQAQPFIPEKAKPSTQNMIEKQVYCRDYKLSSIRKINVVNQKLQIVS